MVKQQRNAEPAPSQRAPAANEALPSAISRGGVWLKLDELKAHLAAALRVDNIGLFLGAGASKGPLGGKTVAEIWKDFVHKAPEDSLFLEEEHFTNSGDIPHFERLLDSVETALKEWTRSKHTKTASLEKARDQLKAAVLRAALLKTSWWDNPAALHEIPSELESHRTVLNKVTLSRQPGQQSPWFFTTNYDLAIEWAAESLGLHVSNGFRGFQTRSFAPQNFDLGLYNTLAKGEAQFGTYGVALAKLHGSLTWIVDESGTIVEMQSSAIWPRLKPAAQGKSALSESVLVYPQAGKYLQTTTFALAEMFRRFAETLAKPQTCLIVNGYSFSDDHINRIIAGGLQNPTLQIVIYLPELQRTGDEWADVTSPFVQRLLRLKSSQVTLVGGGEQAYFSSLAAHLPEPAIYDERAQEMKKLLSEFPRNTPSAS